ncbi:serine/threonine-protein kinase RsbW [Roseivivax marinus]|uniref:ATP-binding protein n=1 Tax=Roseivivax marinus TaxID=1379903 RepID=UPI0008D187D0|nr:ATP-binding protein [Roseivivax marinus]SEK59048.1 serine/threonine-protein kinase RsbW [Roseivivax marinus]
MPPLDPNAAAPPEKRRTPLKLALEVAPDLTAVRDSVIELEDRLVAYGVATEAAGMSALTVAEALNNIVEHALRRHPAQGPIRVEALVRKARMRVVILDHGAPMPGLLPPAGRPLDLRVPHADLPEGGFGWFLIRALTSRLDYRRRGTENRLRFEIDLDAAAHAAPVA